MKKDPGRPKAVGRCKRTRKPIYLRIDALAFADTTRDRAEPLRGYQCLWCGGWHVTSRPRRRRRS